MCCNTAFVLIAPVIEQTVGKKSASPYLYIAAIASIISFVLIYPSPAVVPVMVTLLPSLADPWALDLVLIPVAVIMLVLLLLYARKKTGGLESEVRIPLKKHSRVKAWAPVITPFLLAGLGLLIPAISFFSIISIALFCGLLVAMVSVGKEARDIGIHDGTKYAGLSCLISVVPEHLERLSPPILPTGDLLVRIRIYSCTFPSFYSCCSAPGSVRITGCIGCNNGRDPGKSFRFS
jgi:GntP family gluconate:H+ symporter